MLCEEPDKAFEAFGEAVAAAEAASARAAAAAEQAQEEARAAQELNNDLRFAGGGTDDGAAGTEGGEVELTAPETNSQPTNLTPGTHDSVLALRAVAEAPALAQDARRSAEKAGRRAARATALRPDAERHAALNPELRPQELARAQPAASFPALLFRK